MKIYVAGSWTARTDLVGRAAELKTLGHTVTASWLYSPKEHDDWQNGEKELALRDLADIDRADMVIVDCNTPSSTGGYHVETGYCLGLGLGFWTIGKRINSFQHLANRHFETWEEALEALNKICVRV